MGPLALATPRSPVVSAPVPVRGAASRDVVEPAADYVSARNDRVPSAGEIFNFHPGGTAKWREPFIIDPNEGPLKIHKWSEDELADRNPPGFRDRVSATVLPQPQIVPSAPAAIKPAPALPPGPSVAPQPAVFGRAL